MIAGRWTSLRRYAALLLAGASLAACASLEPRYAPGSSTAAGGQGGQKVGAPYQVRGVWYQPRYEPDYDRTGIASWYGEAFNMKPTANGEIFDMNAVSAAHTTLPLPSLVEVTNLDNGRRLMVRVNDRGPFVENRLIDLSKQAARELGYDLKGLARVRVRYVGPAPLNPDGSRRTAGNRPAGSVALAQAASPQIQAQTAYAPPSGVAPVQVAPLSTALAPMGDLGESVAAPAAAGPPQRSAPPAAAARTVYRIQVGAFSDPANAERAVSLLAQAGQAVIEPVARDGTTLYRVVMDAPADEAEALSFRDRVAGFGFGGARVIRAAGL